MSDITDVIEDINGVPVQEYSLDELKSLSAALNDLIAKYAPESEEDANEKKMQRTYKSYTQSVLGPPSMNTLGFWAITYEEFKKSIADIMVDNSDYIYPWRQWFDKEYKDREAAWRNGTVFKMLTVPVWHDTQADSR